MDDLNAISDFFLSDFYRQMFIKEIEDKLNDRVSSFDEEDVMAPWFLPSQEILNERTVFYAVGKPTQIKKHKINIQKLVRKK
jgi:hypothetical protein